VSSTLSKNATLTDTTKKPPRGCQLPAPGRTPKRKRNETPPTKRNAPSKRRYRSHRDPCSSSKMRSIEQQPRTSETKPNAPPEARVPPPTETPAKLEQDAKHRATTAPLRDQAKRPAGSAGTPSLRNPWKARVECEASSENRTGAYFVREDRKRSETEQAADISRGPYIKDDVPAPVTRRS
jgi:hypothetical protein